MRTRAWVAACLVVMLAGAGMVFAQGPRLIEYRGRVAVGGGVSRGLASSGLRLWEGLPARRTGAMTGAVWQVPSLRMRWRSR
jgi:hypothetical protein